MGIAAAPPADGGLGADPDEGGVDFGGPAAGLLPPVC
ncbi:MAG: hypothetical protein RLZZ259_608, partial [Pseudomonadota bacterium]